MASKWDQYAVADSPAVSKWDKYASTGDSTTQGESGDDHTGGMSRVSALDYWIKNPAKSAVKAYVNDAKDIGNALTHPLDTAVGMVKSIPKNWGDVGNAIKGIPDMVSNHPIQTALALAPGAEGAVGLAEKGVGAAKTVMTDIGKKNLENNIFGLYNDSVGAKIKNLGDISKVKPQRITALKAMSDNLPNVKLESGDTVPKSRWDLAQTFKQTKQAIYEKYTKLSGDASEAGAKFSMIPIIQKAYKETIDKLGEDTIKANPGLLIAIKKEALNESKIGTTTPSRAQVHMQSLNNDVKASYNSGQAVHYSVIDFKRSLLNHLNDATEKTIEDTLNKSGYGELRDQYAALKSSEKEIVNGANKYLRETGGHSGGMAGSVVNLWSMEELMTAGVKGVVGDWRGAALDVGKAGLLQAAKRMVNHLTSPDAKIPKMFNLLDKYKGADTGIGKDVNVPPEEVSPHRTPPNPVNAELVDNKPKGIGVDKPIKRADRLLPSDAKRGTGPVIKQGGPGQTKIGQEKRLALPRPVQVKGEGFTMNNPSKGQVISDAEAGRNPMDEDNSGVILHKTDIQRAKEMAQIDQETKQAIKKSANGFLKDIRGKISSEYGKQGHFMYEEFSELKKSNPEMFSPKGMKPDAFISEIARKYPEIFNYKDPETLSSEDLVQAAFMAKKLKGGK